MEIFTEAASLQNWLKNKKNKTGKSGFVPTMGALHQGHISLINHSVGKGETCIVSIFVNPTQFNNSVDFEKYPRPLKNDIETLQASGCHCLYLPAVEEIYPSNNSITDDYEIGYLENILEGKYRPGHFKGVVQIVNILLQIVKPDILYLGIKDFQQCLVLKDMIAKKELPVIVETLPIFRENSGLAMSSRNMRLSAAQKEKAALLYASLCKIKKQIAPGEVAHLAKKEEQFLNEYGFKTDYITIADAATLEPVKTWDGTNKLVALVAAYLGEVRLIDNLILP